MRSFILGLLATALISCQGSSKSAPSVALPNGTDATGTGTSTDARTTTMLANSSLLPACTNATANQLFYVMDRKSFVVCDVPDWTEIDISGKDGAPGAPGADAVNTAGIKSVTNIGILNALCTAPVICSWNGGQITTFADGTKLISGVSTYYNAPNNTTPEQDGQSVSMTVPANQATATWRIIFNGRRNNVLANIFLEYTRSPEKIAVIFDTNVNQVIDPTDEVIGNPTITP